jgi:uncharacterized lipoprotein YddW (UPF0748 family)
MTMTRWVRVVRLALPLALLFPIAIWIFGGETRLKARTTDTVRAEVRALWVTRASLVSARAIDEMVRAARQHGFNTIFVQVRGRGDAYFSGGVEGRASELAATPAAFDPLADVIQGARAAGLRVHAWINVNLVASAVELPSDRTHILYRHPEWLMVPREIATQLARYEPNNPAYAGAISRWTRAQAGLVEGLYASPIIPASADHVVSIVTDLARRYDLDGVHLDYVRYPNETFDHSRFAIAEFRSDISATMAAPERYQLDRRATVDPFAWPDAFPEQWRDFRRARLSQLVRRIRSAVKTARPSAVVSAAVAPDTTEALENKLQNWRAWVEGQLIDVVCPMAYTQDPAVFDAQIAAARQIAGPDAVWAGIGAFRLTPAQTVQHIGAARRAGAAGIALFSYDSVTAPPAAPDYLAAVARSAFGAAASASGGAARP